MLISVANVYGSSFGPYQSNSWKNGYPDRSSIPQEKSPSVKELNGKLCWAMYTLWATQWRMPRDIFPEYVRPNPPDLPFHLVRIAQERWGALDGEGGGTNRMWSKCASRDNLREYMWVMPFPSSHWGYFHLSPHKIVGSRDVKWS